MCVFKLVLRWWCEIHFHADHGLGLGCDTRSLLFQLGLPNDFWGDILHASYLLNKLPIPVLSWKTPYKLLFKKIVNYDDLKCFGCLCYSTNVKPVKDKFSPRALKCVLVEYSPGQKGYKLYCIASKTIITAMDVVFY